jgi:hypothetical protein
LIPFLEFARESRSVWDRAKLAEFAALAYPDETLSRSRALVRGDTYLQWVAWTAEGIADPRRYVGKIHAYGLLFETCLHAVRDQYPGLTESERRDLSSALARYLKFRVDSLLVEPGRRAIPREQRYDLIEVVGKTPRCWITGYPFSDAAISQFLGDRGDDSGTERQEPLPLYVDIYRPIGIRARDLAIEVDHVYPVSQGGTDLDNLRLACGWANSFKSDNITLYDVPGLVRSSDVNGIDRVLPLTLPQPFWVIRILATRRCCEAPEGCKATADESVLTVAPIRPDGAPTPTNLRVVCEEHDPLRSRRFVPRAVAERVWRR